MAMRSIQRLNRLWDTGETHLRRYRALYGSAAFVVGFFPQWFPAAWGQFTTAPAPTLGGVFRALRTGGLVIPWSWSFVTVPLGIAILIVLFRPKHAPSVTGPRSIPASTGPSGLVTFLVGVALGTGALALYSVSLQRANEIAATTPGDISALAQRPKVEPTLLSRQDAEATVISGKSFYLADLMHTLGGSLLIRKTFENCEIYGPGVVLFSGSMLDTVRFLRRWPGPIVEPLTQIAHHPAGVVRVELSTFRNCRFWDIGILAPPGEYERILRDIQFMAEQ